MVTSLRASGGHAELTTDPPAHGVTSAFLPSVTVMLKEKKKDSSDEEGKGTCALQRSQQTTTLSLFLFWGFPPSLIVTEDSLGLISCYGMND